MITWKNVRPVMMTICAGACAMAVAAASAAPPRPASRGTMVEDDGQNVRVLHFSQPDFDVLRMPRFTEADLPLFERILSLSEPQVVRTEEYLQQYLEAFRALAAQPLSMDEADQAEGDRPRRGGSGGNTDWISDAITEALNEAGFGELEREGINTGVDLSIGGDGDDPPRADVRIRFGGEDLTEAQREKLQGIAEKLSQSIQERMQKQIDEGGSPFPGPPPGDDEVDHFAEQMAKLAAMRERVREYRREHDKLATQFESSVMALLADPQLEHWNELQRALVRRQSLSNGRLSGETIDLLSMLEQRELTDAQHEALAEHIETFEMSLHEALVRRNRMMEDFDFLLDETVQAGDFKAAYNDIERMTRLHVAVRDLNDLYTNIFADALSGDAGKAFRIEALREGYPEVYTDSLAQRAIDQSRELDGLSDEARSAINQFEQSYHAQLGPVQEQLLRTVRREQPEELKQSIERIEQMYRSPSTGLTREQEGEVDPIDEAKARRRALDRHIMTALYGVFTPEQREALPRIPEADPNEPVWVEAGTFPEDRPGRGGGGG